MGKYIFLIFGVVFFITTFIIDKVQEKKYKEKEEKNNKVNKE